MKTKIIAAAAALVFALTAANAFANPPTSSRTLCSNILANPGGYSATEVGNCR
jgi:hypothetical protein